MNVEEVQEHETASRLERQIEQARNLENKPDNEACTCEWVIRPMLEAAGYAMHEIKPQDAGGAGGIPDYTILPNTQWTWYVEAKAWEKNIENGADAVQALNYANAQGRRWVVLSNGRQWLLFDNHLTHVEAPQRVVARAELDAPDFIEFMMALSKPSITAGKLEQFVTRAQIRCMLDKQLRDKDSVIIKAITRVLKKLGVAGVQSSDVAEYFCPPKQVPKTEIVDRELVDEESDESAQVAPSKTDYTLAELWSLRQQLAHSKPKEMVFPDGRRIEVNRWRNILVGIVEWLINRKNIPIPFRGLSRGQRWLVNYEPTHENGEPMLPYERIQNEKVTIFVDTQASAWQVVLILNNLCRAVDEPPEGFVIKLAQPLACK